MRRRRGPRGVRMTEAGRHGQKTATVLPSAPGDVLGADTAGPAQSPAPQLLILLAALVPVGVAIGLLHDMSPVSGILGIGAAAAVVLGMVRNHPSRQAPWALLAAGVGVVAATDLTGQSYAWAFRPQTSVGPSALLPLAAYPLLVGGLLG